MLLMDAEDVVENTLDLLAIGETLIDFISTESSESLRDASRFERYQGGSPANIAVTVARLGGQAAIASKVGAGAFGTFLRSELEQRGVVTDYLINDPAVNTTVIFVARTPGSPDFEAFRFGDAQLRPEEIPDLAIERARAVHASTFALSREPCRSAVIAALKRAAQLGKVVSLDPNYHPRIWGDIGEARRVLAELYAFVTVTKPSLDDAVRLFGAGHQPEAYLAMFHELGPRTVVLTMGKDGALLSHNGVLTHVPARPVQVIDSTGAGDAFWGGFLTAWLDGLTPEQCVHVGSMVVAQKLQTVGQHVAPLDRKKVYEELALLQG